MTDFRLLRAGGFYHTLAHNDSDSWKTFTYAGLHANVEKGTVLSTLSLAASKSTSEFLPPLEVASPLPSRIQ